MAATLSPALLTAVPLLPLAGAVIAGLFGKTVGRRGAHSFTILGVLEDERRRLVSDLRAKTPLQVDEGPMTDETLREGLRDSQVLVHCTPIGMHPNVKESCVPPTFLEPHLTVMDIVYNPLETQLLRDAKASGCKTIRGIEMFLYQAIGQFELWTGENAPADVMRAVLESSVTR